jgi:hypothetical protein
MNYTNLNCFFLVAVLISSFVLPPIERQRLIFCFIFSLFFPRSKTFCLPIEEAASQLNVSVEALIKVFFFYPVAFCFFPYGDVCGGWGGAGGCWWDVCTVVISDSVHPSRPPHAEPNQICRRLFCRGRPRLSKVVSCAARVRAGRGGPGPD